MGIKDILDKPFRKQESLDALLIPREHMMSGILPSDAPAFFDHYATKIQDALQDVYGNSFDRTVVVRDQRFHYHYASSHLPLRVSYSISPIVKSRSFGSEGAIEGPSIYAGIFHLEQTPLQLSNVRRLFDTIAADYLLAWQENGGFQVYHFRGKKMIAEKDELVRQLGITPSDAAVYHVLPGAVFWARHDFSKERREHFP
jgi:hypothetical protein